jgi:hypothetical protein
LPKLARGRRPGSLLRRQQRNDQGTELLQPEAPAREGWRPAAADYHWALPRGDAWRRREGGGRKVGEALRFWGLVRIAPLGATRTRAGVFDSHHPWKFLVTMIGFYFLHILR